MEVIVVATETNVNPMEEITERAARSAQESARVIMDYAVKAQELNMKVAQRTAEVCIDGLRKQTELSLDVAQEFSEKVEEQAEAFRKVFEPWLRMTYAPFFFFREEVRDTQRSAGATGNGRSR
jgi:methionyl-tRNA formyltransferase